MEQNRKIIILARGVPGAGKTSLCQDLAIGEHQVFAADDYFTDSDGNYNFDADKLGEAHKSCQHRCEEAMIREEEKIFVNNTFVKEQEMNPYKKLAKKYGYRVYTVIVENRHGGKDVHGVPETKLQEMEKNLRKSIKLR